MTNDLISRSAHIEKFTAEAKKVAANDKDFAQALMYVVTCLESAPAVDAVPVVRCRECIHNTANHVRDPLDTTDYSGKVIVCDFWLSDGLEPDDYCSRGEMKGGSL